MISKIRIYLETVTDIYIKILFLKSAYKAGLFFYKNFNLNATEFLIKKSYKNIL